MQPLKLTYESSHIWTENVKAYNNRNYSGEHLSRLLLNVFFLYIFEFCISEFYSSRQIEFRWVFFSLRTFSKKSTRMYFQKDFSDRMLTSNHFMRALPFLLGCSITNLFFFPVFLLKIQKNSNAKKRQYKQISLVVNVFQTHWYINSAHINTCNVYNIRYSVICYSIQSHDDASMSTLLVYKDRTYHNKHKD